MSRRPSCDDDGCDPASVNLTGLNYNCQLTKVMMDCWLSSSFQYDYEATFHRLSFLDNLRL